MTVIDLIVPNQENFFFFFLFLHCILTESHYIITTVFSHVFMCKEDQCVLFKSEFEGTNLFATVIFLIV